MKLYKSINANFVTRNDSAVIMDVFVTLITSEQILIEMDTEIRSQHSIGWFQQVNRSTFYFMVICKLIAFALKLRWCDQNLFSANM